MNYELVATAGKMNGQEVLTSDNVQELVDFGNEAMATEVEERILESWKVIAEDGTVVASSQEA